MGVLFFICQYSRWNYCFRGNYRNPNIEEISRPNKVELTLPLVSVLSNEILLCLKSLYGENVMSIDNDKMIVLATCCSEGEISNYRLQFLLSKVEEYL